MTQIGDLRQPVSPNQKEVLTPGSRREWRRWLSANSDREEGIWLVYRKKSSPVEGPEYDDLVEEALCFGWIDSQVRRVDDDRMMQWYSPRRRGGVWSQTNKERIERLAEAGLMTEAGQAVIDAAKADGSWSQADEVDALVVPVDLEAALAAEPRARSRFETLPDSQKRQYLWWVHTAKKESTRSDRIDELVRTLFHDG